MHWFAMKRISKSSAIRDDHCQACTEGSPITSCDDARHVEVLESIAHLMASPWSYAVTSATRANRLP